LNTQTTEEKRIILSCILAHLLKRRNTTQWKVELPKEAKELLSVVLNFKATNKTFEALRKIKPTNRAQQLAIDYFIISFNDEMNDPKLSQYLHKYSKVRLTEFEENAIFPEWYFESSIEDWRTKKAIAMEQAIAERKKIRSLKTC
jgi:hypothetical protein